MKAKYVEIGGIEQWITIRGEDRNNPVVALSARRARRCHESVGVRRVSLVAEDVHRRAMGSAWRRQNVRQERAVVGADHHDRAHDSGRHRAGRAGCARRCRRTRSSSSVTPGARSWASSWRRRARTSSMRSSAPVRSPIPRETTPWPTTSCSRRRSASKRRTRHPGAEGGWPPAVPGRPGLRGPAQMVEPVRGCGRLHLVDARPRTRPRRATRCATSTTGSTDKA